MMWFWTISALMVLGGVLVLVPAFLRKTTVVSGDTQSQNVTIARERLAELEAELAAGTVAQETFEQARDELEKGLLVDTSVADGSEIRDSAGYGRGALAAVLVFIPALTIGMYLVLGSPQYMDVAGPGTQGDPHVNTGGKRTPTMAELLGSLETRVAENPTDPDGWYMLGRVYSSMGRYEDAAKALEELRKLTDDHPTALVALADALAMTNGGRISGRPYQLVTQALDTEPENITALWLSGKGAVEQGDLQNAIYFYRRAEAGLAEEPELLAEVRELISEVKQLANQQDKELDDPGSMVAETVTETTTETVAAPGTSIKLAVSVDPALTDRLKPQDSLFIFAKAVSGPPMPIAAIRRQAGELPLQLVLDDSAILGSGGSLADHAQLKITARITSGGQPTAKSGDLQSAELVFTPGKDEALELRIDQVVP